MIASFRSKALRNFWTKGDVSGIRPDWQKRVRVVLISLNAARTLDDLKMTGFGFHALTGDMAGRYSIVVSRNWRITFGWDDSEPVDVDLEDYHG